MIFFQISREKKESLYFQIYRQLRNHILTRKLKGGERLPSTRYLTSEYHIARNIFIEVYEQLTAEGYLEARYGSGTYVATGIPYFPLKEMDRTDKGKALQEPSSRSIDMSPGIPDLHEFPENLWSRCVRKALLTIHPKDRGYTHTGDPLFIEAIKKYLLTIKGIECESAQILICAGSYQALYLASTMLKDHRKKVILEDPIYSPIPGLFKARDLILEPVSTDDRGLITDHIPASLDPCFYCVTPSHHYPTGAVLAIQRRIKLVELAREKNSYILENDYDSDFRFTGLPISSIHLLDPERVVYVGTLSMGLFPGIRLGYLIVPPPFINRAGEIKRTLGYDVPLLTQRAAALFINGGYYQRHLARMKRLYRKKQGQLIPALEKAFPGQVRFRDTSTGLYLTCRIEGVHLDTKKREEIQKANILLDYAGDHQINTREYTHELILGFGNLDPRDIGPGVKKLKQILALPQTPG